MAEQRVALEPEGITITHMSEHDLLEIVEIEEQSGLSRWGWAAYYAELQGANRGLMLTARPTGCVDRCTWPDRWLYRRPRNGWRVAYKQCRGQG